MGAVDGVPRGRTKSGGGADERQDGTSQSRSCRVRRCPQEQPAGGGVIGISANSGRSLEEPAQPMLVTLLTQPCRPARQTCRASR